MSVQNFVSVSSFLQIIKMADGVVTAQPMSNEWTTGLLGCTEDMGNCCFTMFCPCCSLCSLTRRMDITCLHALFPYCWPCVRSDFREKQNIEGSFVMDCLAGWFCTACTACQIHREMDNRGL